ncbi:hypothetical protein RRG08_062395, partial [Elysia crispata]
SSASWYRDWISSDELNPTRCTSTTSKKSHTSCTPSRDSASSQSTAVILGIAQLCDQSLAELRDSLANSFSRFPTSPQIHQTQRFPTSNERVRARGSIAAPDPEGFIPRFRERNPALIHTVIICCGSSRSETTVWTLLKVLWTTQCRPAPYAWNPRVTTAE